MAPHNAADVNASNPDFVNVIAASLRLPKKTPKQVVDDLLVRLSHVKQRRELRGLNHWEEYAPDYLQRLAARHERLRVQAIVNFFHADESKALARAQAMLGDRQDAEDAVSEAFLKLFAGKAGPEHFYRVLWRVCMDRLRSRSSTRKLFGQRWDVPVREENELRHEPPCTDIGGGDPLELLIQQEEILNALHAVHNDSEHRDTRRLDWWGELISHYCPEEV